VVKMLKAHDGCLGADRRRRTRQAAKIFGEPQAGYDPEVSEWGNPSVARRSLHAEHIGV